jgi:hypothetical protein
MSFQDGFARPPVVVNESYSYTAACISEAKSCKFGFLANIVTFHTCHVSKGNNDRAMAHSQPSLSKKQIETSS